MPKPSYLLSTAEARSLQFLLAMVASTGQAGFVQLNLQVARQPLVTSDIQIQARSPSPAPDIVP